MANGVHHPDRVRARLLENAQRHTTDTVHSHHVSLIGGTVLDPSDLVEAHLATGAVGACWSYDDVPQLLRAGHLRVREDVELLIAEVHDPAWQHEVGALDRLRHVEDAEIPGPKAVAIHSD